MMNPVPLPTTFDCNPAAGSMKVPVALICTTAARTPSTEFTAPLGTGGRVTEFTAPLGTGGRVGEGVASGCPTTVGIAAGVTVAGSAASVVLAPQAEAKTITASTTAEILRDNTFLFMARPTSSAPSELTADLVELLTLGSQHFNYRWRAARRAKVQRAQRAQRAQRVHRVHRVRRVHRVHRATETISSGTRGVAQIPRWATRTNRCIHLSISSTESMSQPPLAISASLRIGNAAVNPSDSSSSRCRVPPGVRLLAPGLLLERQQLAYQSVSY